MSIFWWNNATPYVTFYGDSNENKKYEYSLIQIIQCKIKKKSIRMQRPNKQAKNKVIPAKQDVKHLE